MSDDQTTPVPIPPTVPAARVSEDDHTSIVNRVRRAQGQLGGVLRMIEEGRELGDIVAQLKAVTRALDKAAFTMLAGEFRRRAAAGAAAEELGDLEKVFLSLS